MPRVTAEQEVVIKVLFEHNNWDFAEVHSNEGQ